MYVRIAEPVPDHILQNHNITYREQKSRPRRTLLTWFFC